ncbi:MAG: tetratricopeptide repeat protein [Verrucomicrobiia bacterium]
MTVSRGKLVGVALVIVATTVWLYWPSVHGEFLSEDDSEYLRQAERVHGLTWNSVKWAFTTTAPYYHPLPRLSHVLDYQIWGINAAGHHATSVILHALNAALVFGFLWTLLGATSLSTGERLAMALGVALAFAIHPFQSESVAWMSGRTQLLCTTFGIGCLWAYAAGSRRWVVWGLFVLAVLSKPMAVSLPFVMLAMDYFPLRRYERIGWGRLLREKVVLIGLGAAAAAAAMITESQKGGLIVPLEKIRLSERVLLMFQSLMFYPWKLVWPTGLSPYYPLHLGLSPGHWPVLVSMSVLGVGIITGLVVWAWQRLPALAASWGAYVMLILPLSGLMPTGLQSVELRYAYLTILPLLLMAGGAAAWAWRRSRTVARVALIGLLGCELCGFGLRTRSLIPVWHDDETWWRAPVKEFPDSELAHLNLGNVLLQAGRLQEAIAHYEQALRINPDLADTHNNLGTALGQTGKIEEAIAHYEQALQIDPDLADAHVNLGVALAKVGKPDDAIRHYQEALRLRPDWAEAHINLGNALLTQGKGRDAMAHYEAALRLKPDSAEAHINLGNALLTQGKGRDAIAHYEEALRLKPDSAEAHDNLGIALAQAGRLPEAMKHWEQALKLKPDDVEAHMNLGNALQGQGRTPEAIEHYQQALKLRPDYIPAKNALTRLQARQ